MTKVVNLVLIILVLGIFCVSDATAQTTEISYQGNLKESGLPANANYDIEFRLYGALSGGPLIGTEIFLSPVTVTDGVFSVKLDFGANGFPGQDRYLEIAVRRTGVGSLVTLGPRQKISSAPYAIQSLQAATATTALIASNAQALGGVGAAQYVLSGDPRLSDARNPLPGSPSYIQNTNATQASSNFNVSGNGTANTFNAVASYNFGGSHLMSAAGLDNTFVGSSSGLLNLGQNNAFFGAKSGFENKQGSFNAIFGAYAGQNNITGNNNSFFGYFAGNSNTSGNDNSFFGNRAGQVNTSGAFNSFFGTFSGFFNSTGSDNSFFGIETGYNSNGNRNSFFGSRAGRDNSSGSDNAFLGSFAGRANTTGSNNSFVGSNAGQANATGANNSFFGAQTGFTNTASNNSFFGTDAGRFNTSGANNTFLGRGAGHDNTTGELNVFIGLNAGGLNTLGRNNTVIGSEANVLGTNLSYATAIGAEAIVNSSNTVVLGRPADVVRVPGNLNVLGTLTAATLSISASNLTGVVGTANGGTGLSSPGMPGRFLRSDGTNWQSLPITVADILAGSTNYIQNTTTQQGSTNFNISGNGTAGGTLSASVVNSVTQFNIGGSRVLAASGSNLFTGLTAGNANTTGTSNAFFGSSAGSLNTAGGNNSFFGASSGLNSSTGGNNTFAGATSGSGNTIGTNNSFFGVNAGQTNTIGSNNTVIGASANVGGNNLTYATAIGADSVVSTNNTVVLGRSVDTVRTPGNLQVDGNLIANNFSVNAANLTGTVGVGNGGTGMNSSGIAGNYLRSNGSAWESSAIAASDLPGGSINYVQNGLAVQSSANFNVSGNGTVGGVLAGNSVNSATQYNILGTRVLSNTGSSNIFVGAGTATTGNDNSFFGQGAGSSNTTGFSNTLLGSGANVGSGNLSFATAVGAGATVSNNNSIVLGRAADTVRIPGNLILAGNFTPASFTLPSSITGTLGTANGGTGLSVPGTTGNILRSNGSVWTSSALVAGDIPSLAGLYVQNSTNSQAGANFNVGGNGTIGGSLTVVGAINGSLAASNLIGPVGVSNGGTGLSTAGTSGHFLRSNGTGFTTSALTASDITVGTLGTANGGTGLSAPGTTGNFLRSNGSVWTSSALVAGDIPSLAGLYVQNSTNSQAGANFNVGGNGTIGGSLTVVGAINGSLAASNLIGPVGVSNGGTGLSTAGTSGHFLRSNGTGFTISALTASDITGGTLGSANGGTGLSIVGASGNFLRSTGTGWISSAFVAADIPVGSTNYIQNGTSSQGPANFNIGGTGVIGSNLTVGGDLTLNGALNGTFTVSAGSGGTGLSSSTATQFLRGNNAGGWTSGLLLPGDIPNLGGTYILNQTSPQLTSNFNVSGNGTVGGTMSADILNATTQFNINSTRALGTNPSGSVFVGNGAGNLGGSNAFFGTNAGNANSTGSSNTAIGAEADVAAGNLSNATAIGANASVSQSNSLVLGGVTGTNGGTNTSVGIGTTAPKAKLDVTGGNILVATPGQGIILKSPDGLTCKLLSIDNVGAMVLANTTCP